MSAHRPAIAVFGSSEPVAGEPLYEEAVEVGRLLASAGFDVVTGGYGGVMEGASRGAASAGAHSHGVGCEIFADRTPNPYLTSFESTGDLFERTRRIVDRAAGFAVLDGRAGTLAELAFLWALRRAGCLGNRPVVLWRNAWGDVLARLVATGKLDEDELRYTTLVRDAPAAAAALRAGYHPRRS